jgi:hypothetical protein
MVPILGQQHPTLLLTTIPNGPIVEVPGQSEVREGHHLEPQFGQDRPEIQRLKQSLNVCSVALDIYVCK